MKRLWKPWRPGYIVGIQDMGAAGLTCATCEMSAKGEVGMDVDVRKVPQREAGMTPYEIMLSESQERMLAVIDAGHEDEVAGVFHKWGLNAVVIGFVTDTGRVVLKDEGMVVADVPGSVAGRRLPDLYAGRVRACLYQRSAVGGFERPARNPKITARYY